MIFNMSDFSNKYKSAVEEMKISPDFKERTEKMMIELRDSENAPKRSHIRLYRSLSVIAAAAACVAILDLAHHGRNHRCCVLYHLQL